MTSSLLEIKKSYRLTEPQKMIYLSETFFKDSSINTICVTSDLGDHNNINILLEVLSLVIENNQGLNLRIGINNGIPYQYVESNLDYSIEIFDFRGVGSRNKEIKWLNEEINYHFNMFDSRLFRIKLFYSNDFSLKLLFTTHHIISDAWSHQNLTQQIHKLYQQINGNKSLIETPSPYLDFLQNENEYFASDRFKKSGAYWKSKFSNYISSMLLDDKVKQSASPVAKRCKNVFTLKVQNEIVKVCELYKISYPTFFLTCLIMALNRLKGENSHLIGFLSYNRLGKSEKNSVGMFVNTLPLLIDTECVDNFIDLIKKVDLEVSGAMKNQRYPLRLLTNDRELKKYNISGEIEIVYSYQNVILPYNYDYHFSNLSLYPILFRPTRMGRDGEFHIDIDYQCDCFTESDIDRVKKIYNKVISEVISNPIKQDKQLIQLVNNRKMSNKYLTLHSIFEQKVQYIGESVAAKCGDVSISYYELNRRANYVSELLIENGGGLEKPVALILDRSIDMMICIIAVLKSGSCYLPLSPEQPLNRLEKIINLSKSTIVLFNNDLGNWLTTNTVNIDIRDIQYPAIDIPNLNLNIQPENLAYIIYTSGSTGEPKGVMIEHKSIMNRINWMQESYPLDSYDTLLQKTPYTFDVSVWELFWWFFSSSCIYFLKPGGEKEPIEIIKSIKEHDISVIHFVPSMLTLFLEYVYRNNAISEIKNLKRVICSGEELTVSLVENFNHLITLNNGTTLHNLYGPTEATVDVTYYDCSGEEINFIPIGKPITGVGVHILNPLGEIVPENTEGEICLSGICLARGYLNDIGQTNEKFVYNQNLDRRIYKTGDLGLLLTNGNIKYIGRMDNQVKIRGNRVEIGEIEYCILSIPNILEVAVTAKTDENKNLYLGAYYTGRKTIPHETIRHYIQNELPSYMVPSYFIQLNEFPLTSSGKLDRSSLPEPSFTDRGKIYHAPINDREEEICEIWEDTLNIEKIGRDDDFFDLGGDSLSLIQVHFHLQDRYDIPLQDLFKYHTVKDIALHIHRREKRGFSFNLDSYYRIKDQIGGVHKVSAYRMNNLNTLSFEKYKTLNLMLTGSTGFLGIYILRELLSETDVNVYLLIRGCNWNICKDKIGRKYKHYFNQELFELYGNRITVIVGDIEDEALGLNGDIYGNLLSAIDSVIHCAADVRHFGKRDEIYNTNVTGTRNIIEFCTKERKKKIVFISTISMGLNAISPGSIYHFTEDDTLETNSNGNVYIDSKIIGENLVREYANKIPVQIIRVGNISIDSESGKFQENYGDNAFYSLFMDFLKKGKAPEIEFPFIDLSYVNETARAVRLLSFNNIAGTYHLFNQNLVNIRDMFIGKNIVLCPIDKYFEELRYGDSVLTHGYFLKNPDFLGFVPYNDATNLLLKQLGFKWSPVELSSINFLWKSWLSLCSVLN